MHLESLLGAFSGVLDVFGDTLSDGEFAGSLADFGQIGAGETLCDAGEMLEVDVGRHRRLSQIGFRNRQPRKLVRQWNVHQLVQST